MEQKRMPIFAERFAQLRGEMTQGEFAEFLGISRPTVGFYENGTRLPDALLLRQIADKCKVSADWLLGKSDIKSTAPSLQAACELTGLPEDTILELAALNDYIDVISGIIMSCKFEDFLNCLVSLKNQGQEVLKETKVINKAIHGSLHGEWLGSGKPEMSFVLQEKELSKRFGFKLKIVAPSKYFEYELINLEKYAREIATEIITKGI